MFFLFTNVQKKEDYCLQIVLGTFFTMFLIDIF